MIGTKKKVWCDATGLSLPGSRIGAEAVHIVREFE